MMTFLSFAALSLIAVSCALAVKLPTTGRLSNAERAELQRRIAAAGGCNANICFALDGSAAITREEFRAQKNFVVDLISVFGTDNAVEVAACQYGTAVAPIQPLTPNVRRFTRLVARDSWLRSANSFAVGGINYCFGQLVKRPDEANKIVFLGDGKSTIGTSAVARADLFRSTGGKVCAVGAGFPDETELLAIAGGDKDKVFDAGDFFDTIALSDLIEGLVEEICGLD